MAPEQRRGEDVGPAADVYSAGIVLYEMLVGELPVGAFRFPSEIDEAVPEAIDDVLRRALAPRPGGRYGDAEEMAGALRRALENLGDDYEVAAEGVSFRRRSPFVFRTGEEASAVRELAEYAEGHPEVAAEHLFAGDFEPWLRSNREFPLARCAEKLRREELDPAVAVQKFLEATGFLPPPQLELDARELDLGTFPRGEARDLRLYAKAVGRGMVWGEARASGNVTPPTRPFKGRDATLEFTLLTQDLTPGRSYQTEIVVESNAGTTRVPVRFQLERCAGRLWVEEPEREIVARGGGTLPIGVEVKNTGDLPLSLSAMCSEEWVEIGAVGDLAPGETREIEVAVHPSRIPTAAWQVEEGGRRASARLTLASPAGNQEVTLRVCLVPSFDPGAFFIGFLAGLIPFVAELVFVLVLFGLLGSLFTSERSSTARCRAFLERRDNLSFFVGVLPGVAWHVAWVVGLL